MKKWLKTVIIIIAVLVFIIVGSLGLSVYRLNKSLKEKYDVEPTLIEAELNDMGLYISAGGNITSAEEVAAQALAYGTVESQLVQVGQKVEAGETLAVIDGQALEDDIKDLEEEIYNKEIEIEQSVFKDDVYYIKAPADGEIKDIKVKEDDEDTEDVDEASDVYEVLEEFGYLALLSTTDQMYAITEETADFLAVGAEVTVSRYDYEYSGVVEKIEDGKTYILVDTDNISIGRKVYIYSKSTNEVVTGTAQLYEWVEIGAAVSEGTISDIYVYNNKSVSMGDKLFKITARSQEMIDLYEELDELNIELEEKKEMLQSLEIVSPTEGIVTEISIEKGDDIEEGQTAYTIADTSYWIVKVDVDELDISLIDEKMPAEVTVDAYDDEVFYGTVSGVSSVGAVSNGVTSYEVYVEVAKNDVFKLNMTANAEIEADYIANALTVPVEAIRYENGVSYVVVYNDISQDEAQEAKQQLIDEEKALLLNPDAQEETESGDYTELSISDVIYGTPVIVETGLINETYAQILSGISEGDIIILPDEDADSTEYSYFGMGSAFD